MAMMQLTGAFKIYRTAAGEIRALDGIDLTIEAGEMVAIMGPSGSGKSTLLNILGCLDRPTAGTYSLNGQDVQHLSDDELARARNRHLGFVFQQFNLLPQLNIVENVELPLLYRHVPSRQRRRRALDMLAAVGLAERATHKPLELSGGQQQRVAVARALVGDPAVILADEPTGNLDTVAGTQLMALFQQLNARERTVVVVTHNQEVAVFCSRIIQLRDGKIIADERVPHPASAEERLMELAAVEEAELDGFAIQPTARGVE